MAEPDEIIERARELRKKVDKAVAEFCEAHARYGARWPIAQSLGEGRELEFHFIDWEEDAREWQSVEEKRQAMESAWREYGDFLEQHRTFLKNVQVL